MRSTAIPLVVLGLYAAVASFVFAAATTETILLYPNIFRDVPDSLALSEQFMSEVRVGDVMRPLGMVETATALMATAIALYYRTARRWVLASLIPLIAGQFLLSVLYLWPRASILYDDRTDHTLAEIERAATEFQTGELIRILAALATAALAVTAVLATHRTWVLNGRRREI
ncbi:hypothetical protein [Nocardia sp. NPDC050406]|uniref:hypothetical protein n=1 Tax=Nocardia sp. NPDC050406 TaxID=3364318 RepID=UPI003795CF5C